MFSPYFWSVVALCLAAAAQFWSVGVLVVSRQVETLLCGSIIAGVSWGWCSWAFLLRKRRLGLALSGFCLFATLAMGALSLLDILDKSDVVLFVGEAGGATGRAEVRAATPARGGATGGVGSQAK